MSTESKKTIHNITAADFEKLNYQDYKAKFDELGIGHVFEIGKKKVYLIEKAMEAIEKLREAKNVEQTEKTPELKESNEKDLKESEAIKENPEEKTSEQKLKEAEELKKAEQERLKKMGDNKPSKEHLIDRLTNIDANLANNIPSHRQILLNQKAEKRALLKKYYKIDWDVYSLEDN